MLGVCYFYFVSSSDRNRSHLSENCFLEKFLRRAARAVQGCTGRVGHLSKRGFLGVGPRPSDTGRVGQHGGPCQAPDFCMGCGFGSSTGRVGLHGPCQLLNFEFLTKIVLDVSFEP